MPLGSLADNVFIVLLAYVAAFLPWTALTTYDFISPAWRRARDIRVAGHVNFVFAAAPAFYILFYMTLQAGADDKEMFTALVALVFALLHLARTLWGLWQLHIFVTWAARSIRALRALGIEYNLDATKHGETAQSLSPEEIADRLFVSDELIENRLFHGTARCYLQWDRVKFKLDHSRGQLFRQRVVLVGHVLSFPFRYLWAMVFGEVGRDGRKGLRQMPHKPEEVWLRWSVAFAAQGLRRWISEFQVASDPDVQSSGLRHGELYGRRRDYFAGRVLATAGLQLWMGSCVPLGGDTLVAKAELLRTAAQSGSGMPFEAPHLSIAETPRKGYNAYGRKLARIIDAMPVSFGQEIEEYDVERLEWLAILLNMGQGVSDKNNTNEISPAVPESDDHEALRHGDVALENLRGQLGIQDKISISSSEERSIESFSACPMLKKCLHSLSKENRLVTEVGELVDCWLALMAGDQVGFLITHDKRWSRWCLGSVPSMPATVSEDVAQFSPRGNDERNTLFLAHVGLEESRLAFQFGVTLQEFEHLEQTLTFMGHVLEILRTVLGRWVKKNEHVQSSAWRPILFESEKLATNWTSHWGLSRDLSSTIGGRGVDCVLEDRAIQTRVLWELQKASQAVVVQHEGGPNDECAVALCLLSFPSLAFLNPEGESEDTKEDSSLTRSEKVQVVAEEDRISVSLGPVKAKASIPDSKKKQSAFAFMIVPQCGPQKIVVDIQLEQSNEKIYEVCLRLRRKSKTEDDIFEWQWWRDSAMGRIMGLKQWQKDHDMPSPDLHISQERIMSGSQSIKLGLMGSENEMLTWHGWKAFRAEHSRLELESEKTLVKYEVRREPGIPVQHEGKGNITSSVHRKICKSNFVMYIEADRESLRNGCLVLREVLQSEGMMQSGTIHQSTSKGENAQQLIAKAQELSEAGPGSVGRASFLLKVAALEWDNLEALQKWVRLLAASKLTMLDAMAAPNSSQAGEVIKVFFDRAIGRRHLNQDMAEPLEGFEALFTLFADLVIQERFDEGLLDDFLEFLRSASISDAVHNVISCHSWIRRVIVCSRKWDRLHFLVFTTNWGTVNAAINTGAEERRIRKAGQFFSDRLAANSDSYIALNRMSRVVLERMVTDCAALNLGSPLSKAVGVCGRRTLHYSTLRKDMYSKIQDISFISRPLFGLGLLLGFGAPGILPDARKAVILHEAAIEINPHGFGLCNLARLLKQGGESVPPDPVRAFALYMQAVQEHNDMGAAVSAGNLLITGTDGIEKDAPRAVQLFEMAIEKESNAHAIFNLGNLLMNGGRGVERDASRAVELYDRVIEEHGWYTDAMYNLAILLTNGANDVEPNPVRAVKLYEQAIARSGDAQTMVNLAVILEKGAAGVDADVPRAVELYETALKKSNSSNAMYNLATLLARGADGVERDPIRAMELYEREIEERGFVEAMVGLGSLLLGGVEGVEAGAVRAAELFERAIKEGCHGNAMFQLGDLLRTGAEGVECQPMRASELFEMAIKECNHVDAMMRLADMMRNGADGVQRNMQRAVELYASAANDGNWAPAMVQLGYILSDGIGGVEKDLKRAAELFEKAIEVSNNTSAMFFLAQLLTKGAVGVERDVQRAVKLYERLIDEENNSNAMVTLALLLRDGADGVEKDLKRAAELFEKAIEVSNNSSAMISLAQLLTNGAVGVERDVQRAVRLYERLIDEENNSNAMVRLASLLQHGADGVEANVERTVALYERAIDEHDNILAMGLFGNLLSSGADGVEPNGRRAAELFERVIRTGRRGTGGTIVDPVVYSVMFILGLLMKEGLAGVERNPARAAELFQMAIDEDGMTRAMVALGDMLRDGMDGVERDVDRAILLYERAIEEDNNADAVARLAALRSSMGGAQENGENDGSS